jgi:hypothetical protein
MKMKAANDGDATLKEAEITQKRDYFEMHAEICARFSNVYGN